MHLVEAVLTVGEIATVPPERLQAFVIRRDNTWILDPVALLTQTSGSYDIWKQFASWRSTWEQSWRIGNVDEVTELGEWQGDPIWDVFKTTPCEITIADQLVLTDAAGKVRDTLESGTLSGWEIRGDDGSSVLAHNRVITGLEAGDFAARPHATLLGQEAVTGWKLDTTTGIITLDGGQQLSEHDSATLQHEFPGATRVRISRVSLSKPWAEIAAQVGRSCAQAVIRGLPLTLRDMALAVGSGIAAGGKEGGTV